MITLYQFPISHFCEKVRWAMDFKRLDYKKENLLPGLHAKKTKPLSGKSAVPVIVDDGKVVWDSAKIISYLDDKYPQAQLTPSDTSLRSSALEWEKLLDREVGVNIRIMCYNTLLDHPKQVIPFFTQGGPWYGKILMPIMFPKMAIKMRQLMKIDSEATAIASKQVDVVATKLLEQLGSQDYLVGGEFSRADLTAASLLAPLAKPQGYGLDWPDEYPAELETLRERYKDILAWVERIYSMHRQGV